MAVKRKLTATVLANSIRSPSTVRDIMFTFSAWTVVEQEWRWQLPRENKFPSRNWAPNTDTSLPQITIILPGLQAQRGASVTTGCCLHPARQASFGNPCLQPNVCWRVRENQLGSSMVFVFFWNLVIFGPRVCFTPQLWSWSFDFN